MTTKTSSTTKSITSIENEDDEEVEQQQQQQKQLQQTAKRNRILQRQPRVKRDSDSSQISPEPIMAPLVNLEFDPFAAAAVAAVNAAGGYQLHPLDAHTAHQHLPPHNYYHHQHHHLLSVPPRIERHASEPMPTLPTTPPHLLSVPSNTAYLMKQHSDPVLRAHYATSTSCKPLNMSGTNPYMSLHRQYSQPLSCSLSESNDFNSSLPLPHHISLPESIYASSSPPPAGSSQYIVPTELTIAVSTTQTNTTTTTTTITTTSTTQTTTTKTTLNSSKKSALMQHLSANNYQNSSTSASGSGSGSGSSSLSIEMLSTPALIDLNNSSVEKETKMNVNKSALLKLRNSKSSTAALQLERTSSISNELPTYTHTYTAISSSSFEHLPVLRARGEELQRSVSSPQV